MVLYGAGGLVVAGASDPDGYVEEAGEVSAGQVAS